MSENNAPTRKQLMQALLVEWLIWVYTFAGIAYYFRKSLHGTPLALPVYLAAVVLGLLVAYPLRKRGNSLGGRIAGLPLTGERRPWYRTLWGITAMLLAVLTFVLGWQITEINLYYIFTRASNMQNMTERLMRPYWPVLGTLIEKMIETIFLALVSTALSIPLGVLVSFLAARNIMLGVRAKWGRLAASVLLAALGAIAGRWVATSVGAALPADVFDVTLIRGVLSLILVSVGLVLGAWAGSALMKRVLARGGNKLVCGVTIAIGAALGAGLAYALTSFVSAFVFGGSWTIFVRDVPIWPWVILAVGAIAGAVLSCRIDAEAEFAIGRIVYGIVRFILNVVRSIEPFVWALIFVTWFRIGPFPGMVALLVHSVAALGKLYSEQIESIDPGPLEAVRSAGANELQTVAYAVVPQIIPPFISFTIYRWDINVRMSTIIGLVGGGGIGQMLFQYQNLGQWRTVSVAVILIVIVVMALDWVSARIREKIL
ncbi:MAG: phosphonate ABC transporter, permease protein PhnE [Chloroflexi bacterium]|nr:phosphonate ABC transporter, permease protein PhnE [Chloroflexota bacterium]